jgi:hypothetical protein
LASYLSICYGCICFRFFFSFSTAFFLSNIHSLAAPTIPTDWLVACGLTEEEEEGGEEEEEGLWRFFLAICSVSFHLLRFDRTDIIDRLADFTHSAPLIKEGGEGHRERKGGDRWMIK